MEAAVLPVPQKKVGSVHIIWRKHLDILLFQLITDYLRNINGLHN